MQLRVKHFGISVFCLLTVLSCATGSSYRERQINSEDLNYCQTNPELLVSSEAGITRSALNIRYCNHAPSNGDLQIITVEVHGKKFVYSLPTPIGAKVYSEYRFGKSDDLLLMSYGSDSPDDDGNLFDYDLYAIGTSYVVKSGRSKRRPRLLDVISKI